MRSEKISFRAIPELKKMLVQISEAGGFKNLSRFEWALNVMAIQDRRRGLLFVPKTPSWIRDLANADPKEQDLAIRHMLDWPTDFDKMLEFMRQINHKRK